MRFDQSGSNPSASYRKNMYINSKSSKTLFYSFLVELSSRACASSLMDQTSLKESIFLSFEFWKRDSQDPLNANSQLYLQIQELTIMIKKFKRAELVYCFMIKLTASARPFILSHD